MVGHGHPDYHNEIAFYPNRKLFFADVHCMKRRNRWENKNFDDMGFDP